MSEIEISSSRGVYPVRIGFDLLQPAEHSYRAVVMDEFFVPEMNSLRELNPIAFKAGEETKTLEGCQQILIALHDRGVRRGDELLAIGGGALQDVATLSASIYMRGIPWTYAPTTAMAMFDSCIGGKSSINVGQIKNLVGNIYPPTKVLVDLQFLRTLSTEARVSGLSEAVKICFARGGSAFSDYLDFGIRPDDLDGVGDQERVTEFVTQVLNTKKWFIEIDEFDKRERLVLNFGHTFGHALESSTGFRLPHGIAIAFGMLAALNHPLSQRTGPSVELAIYVKRLLASVPAVVESAGSYVDWEIFRSAISSDKKNSGEFITLILPSRDGDPLSLIGLPRSSSTFEELEYCMSAALSMELL